MRAWFSLPVRFALYGFLKNQLYFEPFFLLALLEKSLSYLEIGVFFATIHITVEILEIPTGLLSDLWGRRGTLIAGWIAYVASFLLFYFADSLAPLLVGAVLYGTGEAMRTGTHKALIFRWLQLTGRTQEKTSFYGFTRSWSKYGSAVGVVVGALLAMWTGSFRILFLAAVVPYALEILMFLTYPASLEPQRQGRRLFLRRIREAFSWRTARLLLEAMSFDGVQKALEPYAQPLLQAGGAVVLATLLGKNGGVALVAISYLVIYVLSGLASRSAGMVVEAVGGEDRTALLLWAAFLTAATLGLAAGIVSSPVWAGAAILLLMLLQNMWRPVFIARFTSSVEPEVQATMLSVESQARSLATAGVAMAAGAVSDAYSPVYVLALAVASGLAGVGLSLMRSR